MKGHKKAIIILMQDCSEPVRFIAFSHTTLLYLYFCKCFVRANGHRKGEDNFKNDLFLTQKHRSRIDLEDKAKVVASDWETESLPC